MHFGDDVALQTHYVPRRSQRTESVLWGAPRVPDRGTTTIPCVDRSCVVSTS
jgi:hypothetical protein